MINMQALKETPISKKRAELVNKIFVEDRGRVGLVSDFLSDSAIESLPLQKNNFVIAVNIYTYTDYLEWSKNGGFPDNIVTYREHLKLGYAGKHFGIPIIITNM